MLDKFCVRCKFQGGTYALCGHFDDVCAVIYRLLELHSPGALSISSATVGKIAHVRDAEFTYFSFATLTTLGYGDIVALKPTARMIVIIEALIGQLFPATLLARLVSLRNTQSDKEA